VVAKKRRPQIPQRTLPIFPLGLEWSLSVTDSRPLSTADRMVELVIIRTFHELHCLLALQRRQ
jgi:hypothetical protein